MNVLDWMGATDFGLAGLMTLVSFAIVCFPFYRGLRLCVQALSATRRVPRSQLQRAAAHESGDRSESLALLMVRVLAKSLRESDEHPTEFVLDATKQYVMNEYDVHYARPISMFANLLPPLGLLGTSIGMLMLLLSMHFSSERLELAALALTLTKTIFALISFAVLEATKIHLHGRLLACLEDAVSLLRSGEGERRRSPLAARAAPAAG
jgi:hypothetical protein